MVDDRPRLAIIGAGPSGLATAHHLAETHKVWLFDSRGDVGGVWALSSHQAYHWLETNTPMALFPFPGFSMVSSDWDGEEGQSSSSSSSRNDPPYVSGRAAQRYYARFAKEKRLSEEGRLERLKLSTKVMRIRRSTRTSSDSSKRGPGWLLTFCDVVTGHEETQSFDRIVIATGSFSAPSVLEILEGHVQQKGDVFVYHSSSLGSPDLASRLLNANKVVIIGGGKSALDLVAYLTRSRSIEHRSSSVVLVLPPHKYPSALPLPHGRIPSYLSRLPLFGSRFLSPWSGRSHVSRSPTWLEKTRVGQAARKLYWSALCRHVSSNFAVLLPRPSIDAFNWRDMLRSTARLFPAPPGLALSGQDQADSMAVLRATLEDVNIIDGKGKGEATLHFTLADGATEQITLNRQNDILIACTGYLFASSCIASLFEDESEAMKLGIPTPGRDMEQDRNWKSMVDAAIDEARRDPPLLSEIFSKEELQKEDVDTFRLYRHMVPIEQACSILKTETIFRDFAVVGLPQTLSASIVADVQARWLARFFHEEEERDGMDERSLHLPRTQEEAARETSRMVAASIARYGIRDARQGTTMSLELAWYCRSLLSEMGKGQRQQEGILHSLKALQADDFL